MKVILLRDVARIGKQFEICTVPDGHALNFLIPRAMAELATPENLKKVEARRSKIQAENTASHEAFTVLCDKINGTTVTLKAPVNEQGHLFKSIKKEDIAAAIAAEHGAISADVVQLDAPLKEAGEHTITLVSGDQRTEFTLAIVAQ